MPAHQDGLAPPQGLWSFSRAEMGLPVHQKEYTEEGKRLVAEGRLEDPGMINGNGKPIYDTSNHTRFTVSEKDMTDHQKMQWKNFQLWKSTLKIERRDHVIEAITTSDYPHSRMSHHWMGTPFPVIEPQPWVGEVFFALRWYEHALALMSSTIYWQYMSAKPAVRYFNMPWYSKKWITVALTLNCEFAFGYRAIWRLQGQTPNETECYKYGVLETPHRLAVKADRWRRFKNYKEEWMRRYDYYLWGMRPGERWSFFSPCWMAPWPIRFNTKTDYPIRKNPYMLSKHGIRERYLESNYGHYFPVDADDYLTRSRPEVKYIWRGGIG